MNRQRSVSASESRQRFYYKSSPPARRTKVHSTSSINCPVKSSVENSREALANVLLDYTFTGKIVKIKSVDGYGFLSSEQITGDVFFSLHNFTCPDSRPPTEFVGKYATFQIKSVGKRFMEARKIEAMESKQEILYLDGILVEWLKSGSGCLIQVTSGLGASKPHNRIFAPSVECPPFDEGVKVNFRVHMDRSLRVEARHVTELQELVRVQGEELDCSSSMSPIAVEPRPKTTQAKSGKDTAIIDERIIKDLTNLELSDNLIKAVDVMNAEDLANFFEINLKPRLTELSQQPVASKVIVALIKNASKFSCNKIEGTITRTILGSFFTLSSCKQGCQVVQAALDNFTEERRTLIAEQLTELGTVDEFTDLWTHGGHGGHVLFMSMLDHLDESSLSMIGDCLLGNYVSLSCNISYYKPLRALLTHLVNTECFDEIVAELSQHIISMSMDRYGHHIIITLLDIAPDQVKQDLVDVYKGRIMELSLDPVCSSVIVKAIIEGSSNQQAEIIEEVCKVTSKQAEMDILTLAMDRHGHEVVLAMLNGTRHKHIHNILKASILCKQEELLENEYAARVFKEIKMEYHNKLAGNYPTSKCH